MGLKAAGKDKKPRSRVLAKMRHKLDWEVDRAWTDNDGLGKALRGGWSAMISRPSKILDNVYMCGIKFVWFILELCTLQYVK
jgi:hypothetical protein